MIIEHPAATTIKKPILCRIGLHAYQMTETTAIGVYKGTPVVANGVRRCRKCNKAVKTLKVLI